MEITYTTEDPAPEYGKAIRKAKTREELIAALTPFKRMADDALECAKGLNDTQFKRFRQILPKAKTAKGKLASEMVDVYGPILMPMKMVIASIVASEFHAPWGTAFIRSEEMGWPQLNK